MNRRLLVPCVVFFVFAFFSSEGNGDGGGAGVQGPQEPGAYSTGQRAHRAKAGADIHGRHPLHPHGESWRTGVVSGGCGGGF